MKENGSLKNQIRKLLKNEFFLKINLTPKDEEKQGGWHVEGQAWPCKRSWKLSPTSQKKMFGSSSDVPQRWREKLK